MLLHGVTRGDKLTAKCIDKTTVIFVMKRYLSCVETEMFCLKYTRTLQPGALRTTCGGKILLKKIKSKEN